jgi:hypothetical protein
MQRISPSRILTSLFTKSAHNMFKRFLVFLLLLATTLGMTGVADAAVMQSNSLGQNLFTYSEDFTQAIWQKNAATAVLNALRAPNGTMTAEKLVESAGSNSHLFYRSSPSTVANPTFSVYAKAGERNYFQIADVNAGAMGVFVVDLNTGTITQNSINLPASVIPAGNGWYRIAVRIATPSITTISIGASDSSSASGVYGDVYVGDGTSGLYLWGAQWVLGSKPGSYNRTVASALNSTFVPAGATQSNQLGQNLHRASEQFDDAAWTKRGTATATPNQIANPMNGEKTADLITGFGVYAANDIYTRDYGNVLGQPGYPYTFSVWLKRVSTTGVVTIKSAFEAPFGNLTVNLSSIGDGWVRIYPGAPGVTVTNPFILNTVGQGGIAMFASSGAPLSFYLWGAQETLGTKPGAYNRTGSSLVGSSYTPSGATQSNQLGQNLLPNSDPSALGQVAVKDQVTVAPFSWSGGPGLTNAISFGTTSTDRYAYQQFNVTTGTQLTVSFYVQMDDGTAPIVNNISAPADFIPVWQASTLAGTATWVSGKTYRVQATAVSTLTGLTNFGVVKFTTNSAKTFKVSGYQLTVGSKPGAYNPTKASAINSTYIP